MRKKPLFRSEEEKLHLLREYHESGMSKNKFIKVHGLSHALLQSWIRKYESSQECLPLPMDIEIDDMARQSNEQLQSDNAHLRKQIKSLEKALAISRLETKARDMLIDKAEEIFEISIRKKSGAK